ncbi:MAG TPA: DUF4097 family beta strand repeat-containing protein [Acidimicrobiales bacterium]|nr:DUF4097 family beta strand repeat-containing protein [Acidimicrobiales bacterium]
MTRRLLAVLIAMVGTAAVVIVVLTVFFPEEDRLRYTPAGPVRSVDVDVDAGRIHVVAGPADAANVDRTRRYLGREPVTEESLINGVLRVRAECRRFVTAGCAVGYRLEVPAGVAVRIRTDRGSVEVEGITGMVEVDTSAGGVRLVRTRGPVRVTTSAGNVDAQDVVAEFLDATTGGGRIRMSLAEPPGRLGLRTGAGNIDVALPTALGGYRVDADAAGGKVDIGVVNDPGSSRTIMARSAAGNIRITSR